MKARQRHEKFVAQNRREKLQRHWENLPEKAKPVMARRLSVWQRVYLSLFGWMSPKKV